MRNTRLNFEQMTIVRQLLLREYEASSQDNGYLLNQIGRRYADGDPAGVASIADFPDRVGALNGDVIQQASRTYLNASSYVRVTLMPEKP